MEPIVSVVIPTFVESELSFSRFKRLIESIQWQNFSNIQVVVSDHSSDNRVEDFLKSTSLRFKYVSNRKDLGNSSANTNLGLSIADGEFIQVMHCDDWYIDRNAISLFVQELTRLPGVHWGVFAFDHCDEEEDRIFNPIIPSISRSLGNPSTTFFRQHCTYQVKFDNCLININDFDFHQCLLLNFGPPLIIREICIRIGMSNANVAKSLTQKRVLQEFKYHENKIELQHGNLIRDYQRRATINHSQCLEV